MLGFPGGYGETRTMAPSRLIQFYRNPTFDSARGLRLGRVTVTGKTSFSGDIYIEKHQGKHADGDWDYHNKAGSKFLPDVASRANLDLFRVVVTKLFWVHALQAGTGVDKYFDFPDIKHMAQKADDETQGVHVQASYEKSGGFFQFHCYPDPNALNKNKVVTVTQSDFDQIVGGAQMI